MCRVVENHPSRCFLRHGIVYRHVYRDDVCFSGIWILYLYSKKRKIYDNNNKKLQTNRCQPLLNIPEMHIYALLEGFNI